MHASAGWYGDHTVDATSDGVTVRKGLDLDTLALPALKFEIRSERDDPVGVRDVDWCDGHGVTDFDAGVGPGVGVDEHDVTGRLRTGRPHLRDGRPVAVDPHRVAAEQAEPLACRFGESGDPSAGVALLGGTDSESHAGGRRHTSRSGRSRLTLVDGPPAFGRLDVRRRL